VQLLDHPCPQFGLVGERDVIFLELFLEPSQRP